MTRPRRVVDGTGKYIEELAPLCRTTAQSTEQVSGCARGGRCSGWGLRGCTFPQILGGKRREPRQQQRTPVNRVSEPAFVEAGVAGYTLEVAGWSWTE